MKDIIVLAISVAIPLLIGVGSSSYTESSLANWYDTLIKSSLTPPDYTFGIVWPILYVLMGVAAFLVWRKGLSWPEVRWALAIYGGQLILNGVWSWLFFGRQDPTAALIEITALWLALLTTIFAFARISRVAAWLLVPYLLWISFAAYLNYQIVILN